MNLMALPKAELHVHLEGTLEPDMLLALAKKNQVTIPYGTSAEVRAAYQFGSLDAFLKIYYAGMAVLRTPHDFTSLACAYFAKVASQGVRHAEIFFDPQAHQEKDLTFQQVLEGIEEGCRQAFTKHGITSKLIPCILRHLDENDALRLVDDMLPFRNRLAAVGLDSSEQGHPPEKFERVFAQASALGLHVVAHAGEEGPPAYIWGALDVLKAERIDHGVQAIHDAALMQRLAQERIPLTVCPLSNQKLCVFPNLADHNLGAMLDQGLCVMLNSDDPAYFGGYLNDNFLQTFAALPLTAAHAYQLACNSFEASFVPQAQKQVWRGQLDACFKLHGA